MNTRTILTFSLILMGLIGLSGLASAAISVTDGNDNVFFDGEMLTIANWDNCSYDYNYLWVINATNKHAFIGINTSDNLTAGSNLGPNVCSYSLNISKNVTGKNSGISLIHIYIRGTNTAASPNINASDVARDASIPLNNFTIAVTPNIAGGYGVLPGDVVKVNISTSGQSTVSARAGATFTVASTETGATVGTASADTATGNVVFLITPTSTVSDLNNITVSNGYAKRNGSYAVRSLRFVAYDRTINTSAPDTVVFSTVNSVGNTANFSTSYGGDAYFGLTISGRTGDNWGNVSGNYSIYNVTFGNNGNITVVAASLNISSTTGTGTITASCQNFTLVASDTYTVRGLADNLTIANTYLNTTALTTFYVGQNVIISGTINNLTEGVNMVIAMSNGTIIYTINDIAPYSDYTWNHTWNTNATWNVTDFNTPANNLRFALGTYIINVSKNTTTKSNATTNIAITDALTIGATNSTYDGTTMMSDEVYVDGQLTIVGTSTRMNGTRILLNITYANGQTIAFNVTKVFGTGLQTTTGTNGSYTLVWNATNATGDAIPRVNATGTYTLRVSDLLLNASKTITVKNNLTMVLPTTGPVGSSINITGTSTRATGTVLNITVIGPEGLQWMSTALVDSGAAVGITAVSAHNWSYAWNTTTTGINAAQALTAGTYTVKVSDNITTTTATITLGTAAVTLAGSKTSAFVNEQVNLTGTTTYPVNTAVQINVTNCVSGAGNITIATLQTTVNASQLWNYSFVASNETAVASYLGKNATMNSGTANICFIAANNTAVSATITLAMNDNLVLLTGAQAVTGDQVLLKATSSLGNATTITYNVYSGNYNISKTAAVVVQNTALTSGYATAANYNATSTGDATGANLGAGTYTIYAFDGFRTITSTLTILSAGTVLVTAPASGATVTSAVYTISGTSNRANHTNISLQVAGVNVSTMYTNVSESGTWSYPWVFTGWTGGAYTLVASHVGQSGDTSAVVQFTLSSVLTTTTTTTTTEGTTTTSGGTTTTTVAGCVMPGNSAPCNAVSLSEVVAAITQWQAGTMTLNQVVNLINSWSNVVTYPAT